MSDLKLPDAWQKVKLGDLASISAGGTPSRKKPEFYDGNIPWVKTLDLSEGVVRETEEKITEAGFDTIRGKMRPINTVMVAMYGGKGTVGKSGILGIPATTNQAVCCIEPNPEKFEPWFLLYYLINVRPLWMRHAIGTRKDPNISKGIIQKTEIPLPPLTEQQAIAHALRTVQQAREARQRVLALEQERKAALMEYLFTHGAYNESCRQTDIGELPQSWRVVKLGEICEIRYGLGQPPELDDFGVPMIRATDIKSGRIISEGVLRVKREAIPARKKPFLDWGDIIVVRSGAYTGDVAMYDGRWEMAIAGYDLIVSPLSDGINPPFIAERLLADDVQNYFKGQRHRSAQPHINSRQLGETTFALPPFREQQEIANVLRACDTKIAALERESTLLEELFRAMLEELMTGQIRIQQTSEVFETSEV